MGSPSERSRRGAGRPDVAAIEVNVDADRNGWAVLTLSGAFMTADTVDLLGKALLDVLFDGHPVAVLDVSQVDALAPGALGTLVSAADLFGRCGGLIVVSGLDVLDAAALRCIDDRHAVDFLGR